MAKFKRGQPKPAKAGRKPGSRNKVTKAVREAIIEALNAGTGATAFFLKLKNGKAEDRRCFAHICGRLVPLEVSATLVPPSFDSQNMIEIGRRTAFILQSAALAQRKSATVHVLPQPPDRAA